MASQQSGAGKKQRTNSSKKGHNHPIIYRHQDCIPNSSKLGLIENCERQTLLGLTNNQGVECHRKATCDQVELNLKNKTKLQNTSTKKTAGQPEKYKESLQVNTEQSIETAKNNDELSKSRKRRLRKQKLLVSLAPSQPLPSKPIQALDKAPLPKPVSRPIPHPASTSAVHHHHPAAPRASGSGDISKTPSKDQRKRPDKSVSSRSKSIKTKTLIDQSKADIIKTLEEKALNSLLQTLAPLTNTSPKREKPPPPPPVFSFPDKWTNHTSNSNIDDNGVFYFGETKQQLEKLTTNLKEDSSINSLTKPVFAQINGSQIFSGVKPNSENCVSSFTFSSLGNNRSDSFPVLKQPETVSLHLPNDIVNSDRSLPVSGTDNHPKDHFSSAHIDLVQLPVHETNPNTHSVNGSPITNLPSHLVSCESNQFKTTICADKFPGAQNLSTGSALASEVELHCSEANRLTVGNQSQNMKPGDIAKSNKTRENVLLEREAKKAAKLAAKAKHKNPEECRVDVSSIQVGSVLDSKSSKIINPGPEKESPIRCEGETKKPELPQTSQSIIVNKKINVEDKQILNLKSDSQETPSKSKAELKADRRAKQEAQRAAKALGVNVQSLAKGKNVHLDQEKKEQHKTEPINQTNEKKLEVAKVSIQPKPKLFIHLYQEKTHLLLNQKLQTGNLHPAVIRLGIKYSTRMVAGSNARCIALLHALKQMVNDYTTPSEKEFSRGLEEELGPVTAYLHQCRPLAVSMTNALRHIKRTLTQLPNSIPDVEARRKICDVIDTYIHEQIDVAGKAICNTVKQKIANGDVILTYGCSSLVYKILVDSHNSGTKFRVVIVDGLPWREGKLMLRWLVEKGISCTYVLITAASFIMREASKVLLGAHALLANGYVMSRAGSSQVALLAHCYNVPVLVCCETHKFSERVQTDAFVYNELGELCCDKDKGKNRVQPNLTPLSLAYDVTPPDLVSAVVTELAVLPCTSVPVILRIKPSESVM